MNKAGVWKSTKKWIFTPNDDWTMPGILKNRFYCFLDFNFNFHRRGKLKLKSKKTIKNNFSEYLKLSSVKKVKYKMR